MNFRRFIILVVFASFLSAHAHASTVCVDGSVPAQADLHGAVIQWLASGTGTTTIKVAAGSYPFTFNGFQESSGGMSMYGGYVPGTNCDEGQRDVKTQFSIFEGGGGKFNLSFYSAVSIDAMTFDGYTDPLGVTLSVDKDGSGSGSLVLSRFRASNDATFSVANNAGNVAILDDCLVYHQPAATTAALFVSTGSEMHVINCTVVDNAETGIELETVENGTLDVVNTISYDNKGSFSTGNITNHPTVSYSAFFGTLTNANIVQSHNLALSTVIGFVDEARGDYHLTNGSPAVNRGNAGAAGIFLPIADIEGNRRWVGSEPDIGAFETNVVDQTAIVVTNAGDTGAGTLRAAMQSAPANATITFNIGNKAGCPYLIALQSALPDVSGQNLTIDATTQPGWTANDGIISFDSTLCVLLYTQSGVANAFHVPSSASNSTQLNVRGFGLAGFTDAAIKLEGGSGHVIAQNAITSALPLFQFAGVSKNAIGVYVGGSTTHTTIGSVNPENMPNVMSNLISNSTNAAIFIDHSGLGTATNDVVSSNLIGTGTDGVAAHGNGNGITLSDTVDAKVLSNVIDYNTGSGIEITGGTAFGNVVQSNIIGVNANAMPGGNLAQGILIHNASYGNTIGALPNSYKGGNSIAYNGMQGIFIPNGDYGNTILSNGIVDNKLLAIDLGIVGVTPNQTTQTTNTSKPNELQNFPVLIAAFRTATTEWAHATIHTFANQPVQIELYADFSCPAPGATNSGGGSIEWHYNVLTDANGNANFWTHAATLQAQNVGFPAGITMTATSVGNNHNDTSEFSNCLSESNDMIFRNDFEN